MKQANDGGCLLESNLFHSVKFLSLSIPLTLNKTCHLPDNTSHFCTGHYSTSGSISSPYFSIHEGGCSVGAIFPWPGFSHPILPDNVQPLIGGELKSKTNICSGFHCCYVSETSINCHFLEYLKMTPSSCQITFLHNWPLKPLT